MAKTTGHTRFVQKEMEARRAFQNEMDKYGLEVVSGCGGHFSDDMGYFNLTVSTKPVEAKGNKALMERLKRDGYQVIKFRTLEFKTFRRYLAFIIEKGFLIALDEHDGEPYVE